MVAKKNERLCKAGVSEFSPCPSNCREFLRETTWAEASLNGCLAHDKLEKFLEGTNSFSVGATAFQQAPADILENFSSQSEVGFDLIRYFLSISSPEQIKSTILEMDDSLLYRIVKEDYKVFQKLRKERKVIGTEANFLDSKAAQFWNSLPADRISRFMLFCIRDKKDCTFASRFLTLMPPDSLLKLKESLGLTVEEEKDLYKGLEEALYEFSIQFTELYSHLLEIFADEPETFMILSTMAGLVERKEFLLKASEDVLNLIAEADKKNTHQVVLDFLSTLDEDAALEILSMLEEKNHIGSSEKSLLSAYIKGDQGDFLLHFNRRPIYRMK